MEEILSSIRRIIADEETEGRRSGDDELGAAEVRSDAVDDDAETLARGVEAEDADDEDVLELTRVVRESGEVIDLQGERSNDALDDGPEQDGGIDDQRIEAAPPERTPGEERARAGSDQVQRGAGRDHIQRKDQIVHSEHGRTAELMSAATASVAGGAFAKLSQALQQTPEEESVAESSGRTVEQFVEDIARPMLKEWLDQNLPAIVERLVQREIQKISRRAELI